VAAVRTVDVPDLVWTSGAPVPVVLATEARTLFCFETPDGDARVAEFVGCLSVRFGFPNDEVQHGHPVWGSGLTPYSTHEVLDSPLIDELRSVESIHPLASATPFANVRHFVLAFHDSTLEAVAQDVVVRRSAASADEAVELMIAEILPIR
jgi:hypothetical protein